MQYESRKGWILGLPYDQQYVFLHKLDDYAMDMYHFDATGQMGLLETNAGKGTVAVSA